MENILNNSLLFGSIILLVSIFLSKSSARFGLPILVLFMFLGMLVGSEGIGIIYFDNYELTHTLSLIALCLIIFSGGVETDLKEVKSCIGRGIILSSFGVVFTAILVGLFTHLVLKMPILESFLLGSILSATDAAAVFSALKGNKSQVSGPLKNLLKFESGSNDPMAYLLVTTVIGFIELKSPEHSDLYLNFILNPVLGLAFGWLFSKFFMVINNRINLDHVGLYPTLTLAFLFLSYSVTTKLGGNGFLAIYLFGLTMGNQKIVHSNILYSFYDGISWLSHIGLFVMLGLLVFPSRLINIALPAFAIAIFLTFLARPLTVFLSTIKSKFSLKEKFFVSWAGLKGATPIVFASFAATHMGKKADTIFDIVFFVVMTSALLQGTTLKLLAKKLGLLIETIEDPDYPVDLGLLEKTKNGIFEVHIDEEYFAVNNRIVDLDLPSGSWVLFIKRSGSFIIPDGSTTINQGDRALVVTREKSEINDAKEAFKSKKSIIEVDSEGQEEADASLTA